MKTVKESIEELPERIKTIRIHNYKGEYLGTYDPQTVIEKYGHLNYSSGYSESFSKVSIWIYGNTTK